MPLQINEAVNTVKNGIDAADKALDLYNKVVDQVIPWKTFESTITNLTKYQDEYSQQSAPVVGKIKTLLLDSQDEYHKATQSVYEWSGIAKSLLRGYVSLFDNYNEQKAKAQKDILLKVLGQGIEKMSAAQDWLGKSSISFNKAAGELVTLNTLLKSDFEEGSSYYTTQVEKIRKEAYAGAAAGVVAGPLGLLIAYAIASGVVEGKLIPELNRKFEEVKNAFQEITALITQAGKDIGDTKIKLNDEIKIIGELKISTENTKFYVELDNLLVDLLKEAANKLITQCDAYQARHNSTQPQ